MGFKDLTGGTREELLERRKMARVRSWLGHILLVHYGVPLHAIEPLLKIKGAIPERSDLVEIPDPAVCKCLGFNTSDFNRGDLDRFIAKLPLEQLTYPKRKSI